jgi:hypothetical protein
VPRTGVARQFSLRWHEGFGLKEAERGQKKSSI